MRYLLTGCFLVALGGFARCNPPGDLDFTAALSAGGQAHIQQPMDFRQALRGEARSRWETTLDRAEESGLPLVVWWKINAPYMRTGLGELVHWEASTPADVKYFQFNGPGVQVYKIVRVKGVRKLRLLKRIRARNCSVAAIQAVIPDWPSPPSATYQQTTIRTVQPVQSYSVQPAPAVMYSQPVFSDGYGGARMMSGRRGIFRGRLRGGSTGGGCAT